MAGGLNGVLLMSLMGSVLGMFYFGYGSGVINAPEAPIKAQAVCCPVKRKKTTNH